MIELEPGRLSGEYVVSVYDGSGFRRHPCIGVGWTGRDVKGEHWGFRPGTMSDTLLLAIGQACEMGWLRWQAVRQR